MGARERERPGTVPSLPFALFSPRSTGTIAPLLLTEALEQAKLGTKLHVTTGSVDKHGCFNDSLEGTNKRDFNGSVVQFLGVMLIRCNGRSIM